MNLGHVNFLTFVFSSTFKDIPSFYHPFFCLHSRRCYSCATALFSMNSFSESGSCCYRSSTRASPAITCCPTGAGSCGYFRRTTALSVLPVFCPLAVGIIREALSARRTPALMVIVAYCFCLSRTISSLSATRRSPRTLDTSEMRAHCGFSTLPTLRLTLMGRWPGLCPAGAECTHVFKKVCSIEDCRIHISVLY
jgi:hypothetical protein